MTGETLSRAGARRHRGRSRSFRPSSTRTTTSGHEAGDGAEVWHSPDAYADWLRTRGLIADPATVDADELQRALRARDALRALISGDDDGARAALSDAGHGAPVEVRFTPAGPAFVPDGSAASVVGTRSSPTPHRR